MGRSVFRLVLAVLPVTALLAACATGQQGGSQKSMSQAGDKPANYKVGNPYQINGRWYYPKEDPNYDRTGVASWYGPDFHGKSTANGETYDQNALTAAHTTLPMPSYVRVTNMENGRSIILRVNDRGPFAKDRIIDVSRRSAQLLGFHNQGTAKVRVQVVAPDAPDVMTADARVVPQKDGPDVMAVPTATIEVAAIETQELDPPPPATNGGYTVAAKPEGPVEIMPPSSTPVPLKKSELVYVQAGAFAAVENAQRLAKTLEAIASVETTPFDPQGGQRLYRVRLGPLASMEQADAVLGQVVAMGHGNARIVVD